jgi:hypothetical protein
MKNDETSSKSIKLITYGALAAWFGFALITSINGGFAGAPHKPPLALGLTLGLPMFAFLSAYFSSHRFRVFAHSLDLRLITGLHAWRIVAIDFLILSAREQLPAAFAVPAGLGDIATGIGALVFVYLMSKRMNVSRKWFVAWNLFGLLDLITAVSLGILHSDSTFGILRGTGISTALMAEFPRALIPTFLVPLFMLLHLLGLARRNEVPADDNVELGSAARKPA